MIRETTYYEATCDACGECLELDPSGDQVTFALATSDEVSDAVRAGGGIVFNADRILCDGCGADYCASSGDAWDAFDPASENCKPEAVARLRAWLDEKANARFWGDEIPLEDQA